VKIKDYFLRRLTRLEPPYIISLIIYVIVRFYFAGYNIDKIIELWPHFWAHVFYVHGFIYGSISQPGYVSVNHVTWSLEMEVQFYILAPLLANVFRITSPAVRRGVMIGAIVLTHHLVTLVPRSTMAVVVVPFLPMFFVGFLLVDVFLVDWKRSPSRTWVWDVIGVLAWCGGPFLLQQGYLADLAAIFVVWIAYMSAFRGVMLSYIFRNRWIVAIGGMCYTLYLYHPIMLWPLQQVWKYYLFGFERTTDLGMIALQQFVYIASVIALCTVLFVAFEKPFMKRRTWKLKLQEPSTHS
jgi:peptidoglycan/LPS O-acetylase OafA/YrhL